MNPFHGTVRENLPRQVADRMIYISIETQILQALGDDSVDRCARLAELREEAEQVMEYAQPYLDTLELTDYHPPEAPSGPSSPKSANTPHVGVFGKRASERAAYTGISLIVGCVVIFVIVIIPIAAVALL